ncbi:AAA domain [Trypanosoma vivax]|uniref:Putative adenylate kinase n=1 Tax=Trypanosoma vivax (strain Y486) TaxID=1055687 RepID=G0U577_TRYVY|nr:putative adenylate kinase [Trypanosoma vivax]KAH8616641.1 AAA domain [Trypanosoma vivax]CCC51025.1 putative adenylate kinase [Trypanosoma vivax Y486]
MSGLTDDKLLYLKKNNIPQLMEHILQCLSTDMPKSPVRYIGELMKRPVPPRIILIGAPGSGKATQCKVIAQKYNVVHICANELLQDAIDNGSEEGQIAAEHMENEEPVPASIIGQIVVRRMEQDDVREKGWLLSGFPTSHLQAATLELHGIAPHAFIVLDLPDDVVFQRVEHRRRDPVTGAVYHLLFNPPPPDNMELRGRLVQRSDEEHAEVSSRLHSYRMIVDELMERYVGISHVVDANQSIVNVSKGVLDAVESSLLRCAEN